MQSIARAPNPGYGLAIIKSNVILTTILSVLFLHSVISIKSILSILAVLFFLLIITLSDSKESGSKNKGGWILPSFGAFFCFSFFTLVMKYLLNQGVDSTVILTYLCLILSIMFYFDIKKIKEKPVISQNSLTFLLVLGSICSISANLFFAEAVKSAPNPGYVSAVDAASGALTALAAVWFFKDRLSLVKLFGILGVSASLVILLI